MRPATAWRLGILGFALSCVALIVVGAASARQFADLRAASGWVDHTQEVRNALESLLSLLTDAETGQRGFRRLRRQVAAAPSPLSVPVCRLLARTVKNPTARGHR